MCDFSIVVTGSSFLLAEFQLLVIQMKPNSSWLPIHHLLTFPTDPYRLRHSDCHSGLAAHFYNDVHHVSLKTKIASAILESQQYQGNQFQCSISHHQSAATAKFLHRVDTFFISQVEECPLDLLRDHSWVLSALF